MSVRTLVAVVVIAQAVLAGAIYHVVDAIGTHSTQRLAEERLSLLSDTLRSTIDRFVAVPDLVGESRAVARLLLAPEAPQVRQAANEALERASADVGLSALYVLDAKGVALGASNWREPTSFVGHDYAFRPYFIAAMAEGRGRYYGVGVTTGKPGYFLSSRVRLQEGITGIVVGKVDFSPLQASWAAGGEHVLVTDADGVIFLSTAPHLLYRPLHPLDAAQSEAIRQEQRYASFNLGAPVAPHEWPDGVRATRAITDTPWQMSVVTPWTGKGWAPAGAAALAVLASLVLILALATFRQRRARLAAERAAFIELESRVDERTRDLAQAMTQLELEITERQRIDGELHRARDELVQAAKLSAMGQAFSGLAHELNQPLAALRTYLASTRALLSRGDKASVDGNFQVMEGEIKRLGTLTSDLRSLSRRSDGRFEVVDLSEIARHVASLLRFRSADQGASLTLDCPAPVLVNGNPNRLEQVILNLTLNALDAVSTLEAPVITLQTRIEEMKGVLTVSDFGPGISEGMRGRLFEPFFSTKEDGVGLGLAISYAIVRDHFGALRYQRIAGGQTRMVVSLPLATDAPSPAPPEPGEH